MSHDQFDAEVNREDLPLGFNVIMRNDVWPFGEGVVHNHGNPCHNAPEGGAATDLHTVPSEGKKLCWDCEWPDHAEEALNYDN